MKTSPLLLIASIAALTSCDDSQLKELQRQKAVADQQVQAQAEQIKKLEEKASSGGASGEEVEKLKAKADELEKQLEETKKVLAASQAAQSEPQVMTPEALEKSFSEAFLKVNYASLFGGQEPQPTSGPIQLPANVNPYSRKVMLAANGRSVTINATADWKGEWKLPSTDDLAKIMTGAPPAYGQPPAVAGTPPPAGTPPTGSAPPPPPGSKPSVGGGLSGATLLDLK